ncbi:MAG: DUF2760 domain-containing protein [Polyangiaceae bacterium]
MSGSSVSFVGRVWLAWVCSFRVLFDARFAARVAELKRSEAERASLPPAAPMAVARTVLPEEGALQLLALLQREGRFVDFVEQEVASFSDADIGAAARVVHEGCRKALHAHARVVSIRSEAEGARVTLDNASADVKLIGNVAGSAPFRGVLRHRGWRVEELSLPKRVGVYDATVVAAAELEL